MSPNSANPSAARQAWTTPLLSTTSNSSVPFSRPSDRPDDVRHRLAGRGLAPCRRQGRRRDRDERQEVGLVDQVLRPDAAGAQATGADPPANGLGVTSGSAGGLGNCQHSCSILQHPHASGPAFSPGSRPLRRGAGPAKRATGEHAGVASLVDHHLAVHDHVVDPDGELLGGRAGGRRLHTSGVEDDQVGLEPVAQEVWVCSSRRTGVGRREPARGEAGTHRGAPISPLLHGRRIDRPGSRS